MTIAVEIEAFEGSKSTPTSSSSAFPTPSALKGGWKEQCRGGEMAPEANKVVGCTVPQDSRGWACG